MKKLFDLTWEEYYKFYVMKPAVAELLLCITQDKRLAMINGADTAKAVEVLVQGAKHLVAARREITAQHAGLVQNSTKFHGAAKATYNRILLILIAQKVSEIGGLTGRKPRSS